MHTDEYFDELKSLQTLLAYQKSQGRIKGAYDTEQKISELKEGTK